MESIFVTNNQYQPPLYKLQFSNDCSCSYLSNSSSGFESDINETKNDSNGSFESLMDSDLYGNSSNINDLFINDQLTTPLLQSQLTVFDSNQLISNQSTQLWQFLLEILEDNKYSNLIRWTPITSDFLNKSNDLTISTSQHNDNEFIIYDTKELARLWGIRHNRFYMNQKKFNRVLRHYYNKKNILKKPAGKRNTYLFQINVQPYLMFIKIEQDKLNRQQMQYF